MSTHNDVTRMNKQVKVRWTEAGKQYGFITDEETYQRMFHKEYAPYTNVLKVREYGARPDKYETLPHPSEWHEYDINADELNEDLWSEDWHESEGPVSLGGEKL